jgi:CheY-like chemotaxis protein
MAQENLSILVCEDDEEALRLMTQMLSYKYPGWRVSSARDGKIGLELYKEHHHDLVITDFQMPALNGTEMCAEIRKLNDRVKIIFISAYGQESLTKLGAEAAKPCYYFPKPFNYQDLVKVIEQSAAEIFNRDF